MAKLRQHRRRQTFLSAHNFCGRHLGVWRGWVDGRYIRYPYSYIPEDYDEAGCSHVAKR